MIRVPDRLQQTKSSPSALLLMQLRNRSASSKGSLDAAVGVGLPSKAIARNA